MTERARESTLFLSPLDAFTFDFAPANEKVPLSEIDLHDDGDLSDKGTDDGEVHLMPSAAPVPMRAPLTFDEVTALFDSSMNVGSRFFALPPNVSSFEDASTQYVQVLQRQAQALKSEHKERQKRRDAKNKKRDRTDGSS